ncbi:hypothetical protein CULT_430007 [[Clostridium] ultunense Esp]|nr:hypothetical protein CULT_430007 [[Clostridium] ultunense Esp]
MIAGIVRRAKKKNVPVIAFAGSICPGYESLYEQGLTSVHGITISPSDLDEALQNGAKNLEKTAENVLRIIKRASGVEEEHVESKNRRTDE